MLVDHVFDKNKAYLQRRMPNIIDYALAKNLKHVKERAKGYLELIAFVLLLKVLALSFVIKTSEKKEKDKNLKHEQMGDDETNGYEYDSRTNKRILEDTNQCLRTLVHNVVAAKNLTSKSSSFMSSGTKNHASFVLTNCTSHALAF